MVVCIAAFMDSDFVGHESGQWRKRYERVKSGVLRRKIVGWMKLSRY